MDRKGEHEINPGVIQQQDPYTVRLLIRGRCVPRGGVGTRLVNRPTSLVIALLTVISCKKPQIRLKHNPRQK